MLVAEQDFKRVRDLLLVGATAHVEEVRRHAARELDDVHGRHGQPGAVHHAADVAVELDVIQSVLAGFNLERVFLGDVAQLLDVLVAEERVVVEVDLGVERDQAVVLGRDQRIDFHQRSVGVEIRLVQCGEQRDRLVHQLRLEAEGEGNLARLERNQPDARLDVLLDDRVRSLGGDLLDLHAAGLRCHDQQLGLLAVEQHAEVELPVDGQPFLDQQPLHNLALGTGLVRDQRHAEHLFGELRSLFHRFRQLHAAALAASAGVDLRLYHHAGRAVIEQPARDLLRFFDRGCHLAARDGYAVLRENCLCLVFVNFHG